MRAGGSLDVYYSLGGPLPAGSYTVQVRGYTADASAHLRADLLHRRGPFTDGGVPTDEKIASLDGTPPAAGGGFHLQTWLSGTICASAINAEPGDGLVLRVEYPTGTSAFTVVETSLTIPSGT